MLAVTTVMAGTNAGVAAAIDHTNGLHDRFATLPMPPRAARRWPARSTRPCSPSAAPPSCSPAPHCSGSGSTATLVDAVAGLVVLVVLAGAMSALFGRIGDRLRRPDVVQFAGMMVMMPFMFVSSAFAPLDTMPGWMRTLAALNPVAHAADALRGNVLGTATLGDTVAALAAAAALWIVVTISPPIADGGRRHTVSSDAHGA